MSARTYSIKSPLLNKSVRIKRLIVEDILTTINVQNVMQKRTLAEVLKRYNFSIDDIESSKQDKTIYFPTEKLPLVLCFMRYEAGLPGPEVEKIADSEKIQVPSRDTLKQYLLPILQEGEYQPSPEAMIQITQILREIERYQPKF